ncbi:MAG: hypothetical protein ACRC92_17810 [Peptostreptococcaceae bacterium]
MTYDKHKYLGFLGLLSLIGLKGFITSDYIWFITFINYIWFTFFYENSMVYKFKPINR